MLRMEIRVLLVSFTSGDLYLWLIITTIVFCCDLALGLMLTSGSFDNYRGTPYGCVFFVQLRKLILEKMLNGHAV